jgi:hypothetical protein
MAIAMSLVQMDIGCNKKSVKKKSRSLCDRLGKFKVFHFLILEFKSSVFHEIAKHL